MRYYRTYLVSISAVSCALPGFTSSELPAEEGNDAFSLIYFPSFYTGYFFVKYGFSQTFLFCREVIVGAGPRAV